MQSWCPSQKHAGFSIIASCEKEREPESQALPAYPRDLEREGTETVVTSCTKRVMIAQGERDWRLPLSVGFFLITQYNFRHVLLYRASYARSLGTSGYSRGHSASLGPPPGCARGVSVFVVLQLPHFRWLRATRSGLVVVYLDKWLQHLAQARQYSLDLETSSVARLHRLSFNP